MWHNKLIQIRLKNLTDLKLIGVNPFWIQDKHIGI